MPRRRAPRILVALMLLAVVAGGAVVAAVTFDQSRHDKLAKGIAIGGVDVGGLTVDAARDRVTDRAVRPRRRELSVDAGGQTFTLPVAEAQVHSDLDAQLQRALQASRSGWLGSRVARDLRDGHVERRYGLHFSYAPGAISRLADRVQSHIGVAAKDAKVQPAATGLTLTPSQSGLALDSGALRRSLTRALLHPGDDPAVTAQTHEVVPQVTQASLADRYPAFIVVDRKAHRLRLYEHLVNTRTFKIAVGRQGLETPTGLYKVQWKETNPSWHVPDSAWAGKLRGQTIPPGPKDPIKARWMAFDGGAGIHGVAPSEYGSIGHDASHGCVRMRIPDVISLYARTPVGTPVYVA